MKFKQTLLKMRIALSIFLMMIISVSCIGQKGKDIVIGEKHSVYSEILQIDKQYWIHIPSSYNDTIYSPKKYPLLVILDAEDHFELAASIIKFLSNRLDSKEIPEFIIIGLTGANRIQEYTPTHSIYSPEGVEVEAFEKSGGGPNFLKFLEEELIRHIDEKYRTLPYRTLVGHSLGGTLAVYDYISKKALFNSYIAMDPSLWWDNELLVKRIKSNDLNAIKKANRRLYISAAHNSTLTIDTTPMRNSQEAFFAALKANSNNRGVIHTKLQYFENEDHGTVPLPSIYNGMRFIFQDYRMKNMLEATADEINNYFKKSSKRIGMELLPAERVIDIIGNYFLQSGKQGDKAISLFKLNVSNYPNSYHALFSLAEAYKGQGDKIGAAKHYEKSLELNSNNEIAKKALLEVSRKN